jgi:hypothetical protein
MKKLLSLLCCLLPLVLIAQIIPQGGGGGGSATTVVGGTNVVVTTTGSTATVNLAPIISGTFSNFKGAGLVNSNNTITQGTSFSSIEVVTNEITAGSFTIPTATASSLAMWDTSSTPKLVSQTVGIGAYTNDGAGHMGWNQLLGKSASFLNSGIVGTALLGSGTANSSTFLRGDQSWQTISGGSGTVTSVAMAADSASVVSWTGSPIITSGTFTPTFSLASPSQFGVVEPDNSTIIANSGVFSVGAVLPTSLTGTGTIPYAAYGSIPATNIDHSLGWAIITNVYHDCQDATNGAITNSTTLYGGPFVPGDVGKTVQFNTGANQTVTTITVYNAANNVTLANTYPGTVHNIEYKWGHPDEVSWNTQVSNCWNYSNISTFYVPEGNYLGNSWTLLPGTISGAAQTAAIWWIPTTNVDGGSNANRTLAFIGQGYAPAGISSYCSNSSVPYGNWPVPTNGVILSSQLAPVYTGGQTLTNCLMGLCTSPTFAHGNFLALKLVVENITFRTFNQPTYSGLDMAGIGQCQIKNVNSDTATSGSYIASPNGTSLYGIRFPLVNNFAIVEADNCMVIGYYNGFGVSEHLRAGNLYFAAGNEAIRLLQGNHGNYIARVLCRGSPYTIYNSGVVSQLVIGEINDENDAPVNASAPVQAWQTKQGTLLEAVNGDTYGSCTYLSYTPLDSAWAVPTNSFTPPKNFTFHLTHDPRWGPFAFTATGYTNTNVFSVNVFMNCAVTGVTYSNNVPTAQWVNQVLTGPLSITLKPGETVTNNSVAMTVSEGVL